MKPIEKNIVEKNTDYYLQLFWKNTFGNEFYYDNFPIIFGKMKPDGVQFISNGIIIIENKRDIRDFSRAQSQLIEYAKVAYKNFNTLEYYGVLGFGTSESNLIKFCFKIINLDTDNPNIIQIDNINFLKTLKFIGFEQWKRNYIKIKKKAIVIEVPENEYNCSKTFDILRKTYKTVSYTISEEIDINKLLQDYILKNVKTGTILIDYPVIN